MSDLFAFEVPTSKGRIRVVGPAELPDEEAVEVAARIVRIFRAIVVPFDDIDGSVEEGDTTR